MTDELTDLTVDEQKDELENLSRKQLKELRKSEERQTAIDNIDSELSNRHGQEEETETEPEPEPASNDHDQQQTEQSDSEVTEKADDRSELERKVDYLIERCKTTSHQGFKEYDN